ncbi:MAG: 1-pyrroline-5-carboxylate dehydrogenase, partial [Muricauda sp.]|nr:1-pyrroline-5-carboxylate dehydrogenase [Allomuricauda sp.]
MGKGFFHVPTAINEPVKSYAPGTPEREEVLKQYKAFYDSEVDIPLYIGSEEIRTGNTNAMSRPHVRKHILGHYH